MVRWVVRISRVNRPLYRKQPVKGRVEFEVEGALRKKTSR